MKKIIVLCFVLINIGMLAQNTFLIKDVRLFDGEKEIEKTSVLVVDGKISQIAKKIKGTYTTVDGTGKTLIPGLTNAHVHAWMPANLKEAAKAGVLNVLDMHGVEMAQKLMKTYKDSTDYANYFVAGAAATAPEGHGTQYGFPTATLTKPEEASQFIADRINAGADYIKIIVEPWRKTLSNETVKALIAEAHKEQKVVGVHISNADDAYQVLANNADGLVHIWWDKKMTDEQLHYLAKEKSFFVIPTLLTTDLVFGPMKKANPTMKALVIKELQAEVKRLYDAGVPILAGTDPPNAQINYGTDLHKEMILIAEAGVNNIDVLKGATSWPIEKFKLGKGGKIKVGYKADLVLLDGNPIVDMNAIRTINTVWKTGEKVN